MNHSLSHHDHHHADSTDVFGFWIYLMSDCILFSALFACFAVLHTKTAGSVGMKEITNLPYVFIETVALLTSSFTFGMAMLALYQDRTKCVLFFASITFLFGAIFLGLEFNEFFHLYSEGNSWKMSAALSSFFTLVGTHGLHVTIGLIWMSILMLQLAYFGPTPVMKKRFTYFGLFWAFLDVVWIFVFTIVYLMGAI